ncbi:MAG: hypothetical protein ACI808_000952 [Paraglaciecola sp.]
MKLDPSFGALQSPFSANQARRDTQRDGTDRPTEASKIAGKYGPETVAILQGNPETLRRADKFQNQHAAFETVGLHSQTAINSYQSIDKDQQKGEIQLLMGVDTYV